MAIAKHSPSKVYKKNRNVLSMNEEQLDEFASTKRSKLPIKNMFKANIDKIVAAVKGRK